MLRFPICVLLVLIAPACDSEGAPATTSKPRHKPRDPRPPVVLDAGRADAAASDHAVLDAAVRDAAMQDRESEDDASASETRDGAVENTDLTYVMNGWVGGGQELQNCMLVRMPLDRGPIAVHSAESHYTVGSHHFLVYRVEPRDLTADEQTEHLCTPEEEGGDFSPTYYEAQAPDSRRDLPEGVSHVFQPGEILLLTSHYLNVTDQDVPTQVTFTLHTVPVSEVEQEAGSIYFYNPYISIPPGMRVSTTRSCPIPSDINLALLWSHMHSRGIAFNVFTDDERTNGPFGVLYQSKDWSEPKPREYPARPPFTVHAGSKIIYECTFENHTDGTINAGLSAATDEMCILHGMYWPRVDPKIETCLMGKSKSSDPVPVSDSMRESR
jgi:hypothetical protein